MSFLRPESAGREMPEQLRIVGEGEMAALFRSHDWSRTPLGPLDAWPETLVGVANLILASPLPAVVWWGPELTLLYNDNYRPFCSTKHPAALGSPGREIWKEAWGQVGHHFEDVYRTGEPNVQRGIMIPVVHEGTLQDFFWNYTISALYRDGAIAGLLQVAENITGEILANRRLLESEARASRILDSIGDAVIVTDAESLVTRMNPVAQRLTGWSLGDAVGRPLAETFHIVTEATHAVLEDPADKVKRLEAVVGLANHTVLVGRDGAETFIDDSAAPILDDQGNLTGTVLVFRDVSERRAAERERSTLARRLEQVLGATSEGIVTIDRNWIITYLNLPAKQFAAARGDVLGRLVWEAFPALNDPDSPFFQHYHRAMDEGIGGQFEAHHGHPLNHWVNILVRPAPEGIVLFIRNVTLEKTAAESVRAAAEALAASEEELRWTVELSLQVPWTADPQGNILSFNERWLRLTGLSHQEGLGNGWTTVQHPDDLASILKAWIHAVSTGDPLDHEHRIRTASGDYRWMRTRAFPRRDGEGRIVKWYGSTEDIHERKRVEAALLQNEKLAAVGRLSASISHEINNPLEAVTNLLYLARTSDGIQEIQHYIDLAEVELRRVAAITSQTLRFHRQATSPTCCSCQDLIAESVSIYQGRLKNSGVYIEKRKRAQQPIVCFEGEIRQVLNNLIGNAIDAMIPGGGCLRLRSREATLWSTGKKGIALTVADTGSGMSPQTLKTIFQPFFSTKGIGGTGLGLWISDEIVRRHGGAIRVRSRHKSASSDAPPRSHGTVFTVFLPFRGLRQTER